MTPYNLEALNLVPDPTQILEVLTIAMGGARVPLVRRVLAGPNSHAPEEGLALLTAYVAIEDSKIRQAILDAVVAIAGPASKVPA